MAFLVYEDMTDLRNLLHVCPEICFIIPIIVLLPCVCVCTSNEHSWSCVTFETLINESFLYVFKDQIVSFWPYTQVPIVLHSHSTQYSEKFLFFAIDVDVFPHLHLHLLLLSDGCYFMPHNFNIMFGNGLRAFFLLPFFPCFFFPFTSLPSPVLILPLPLRGKWWLRMQPWELDYLESNLHSDTHQCVTLGISLHFPLPQYLLLSNGHIYLLHRDVKGLYVS